MDSGKLLEAKDELGFPEQPIELEAPRSPGYQAVAEEPNLNKYWLVIRKRKWTLISSLVIVLTLAGVASFKAKRMYSGACRIAINREAPDPLGFNKNDPGNSEDWDLGVTLDTQVSILRSEALAMQVIKQLQLEKNPAFHEPDKKNDASKAQASNLQPTAMDPRLQAELLENFATNLSVLVVPRTRIVELRFMSPDPRLAAEIANTLANTYIEYNFKTKFESTMQTSDWLKNQLSDLQMRVETAQEKLVRYQRENGIVGVDEKQNIITQKLDDLNKNLTAAESERIQKEASYHMLRTGDVSLVAKLEPDSLVEKLRTKKAELASQYAQLTTQFGPAYPKVVEVKNQLDEVNASIATEGIRIGQRIKSEYEAAGQRERLLRAAFDAQKIEANKLNERAIEYNLLKRDVEASRQVYEGLLQKLKEAGVSAGLRSSNIQIVDAARVPVRPSKPNIPRNLELGFLIGLFGGIVLAFAMEAMDNTVRTPDEALMVSALPALGVIPLDVKLQGRKSSGQRLLGAGPQTASEIVTYSRPNSEIAESYKALRTSILLSSLGTPPKVILITSAFPKEGKTTTSVNTAMVLAQKGVRVLLVDTDLRRPSVHKALGIRSQFGLSTLLTGSSTAEEVILPTQHPNLFVIPAGPLPPHPAELLGSNIMTNYIKQWRQSYDHIILDSPPSLSVTDAVLLSVNADAVVIVIRSGQTTKEALRRTRDLLLQVNAKVMGVVINAIDLSAPDYYHYYYYGSKSKGGYYTEDAAVHK